MFKFPSHRHLSGRTGFFPAQYLTNRQTFAYQVTGVGRVSDTSPRSKKMMH